MPWKESSVMEERLRFVAAAAEIELIWRPFLLGPIFAAQGWRDSPFNLYPAKGRYMRRDMQRICRERGLAFQMPEKFPANGLLAARLALIGAHADENWAGVFTKLVFCAQFGDGTSISEVDCLSAILDQMGLDSAKLIEQCQMSTIKEQLRNQTERAQKIGVFGAPTFVTEEGELFWGDDRLENALM